VVWKSRVADRAVARAWDIAADSVEEIQRRRSRGSSIGYIPADKVQKKHRRQGHRASMGSAVIDGEAPTATPRSNLDSTLSNLDMENRTCSDTKRSQWHEWECGRISSF
jgi:hypothetical protein